MGKKIFFTISLIIVIFIIVLFLFFNGSFGNDVTELNVKDDKKNMENIAPETVPEKIFEDELKDYQKNKENVIQEKTPEKEGASTTKRNGDTQVLKASFTRSGDAWNVDVTLKHPDSGWDHYADMWRLVTEDGEVVTERVLAHPHEDEQPFTRGLYGVKIPEDINILIVEARDTVHGWSDDRVRVDLTREKGDKYVVKK